MKINKNTIYDELRSWVAKAIMLGALFVDLASRDGVTVLTALYKGDYSPATILGLKMLVFSTMVKVMLTMTLPKLFPKRSSEK